MSLAAGTRLGPYEILGPLGAGGMGEVYRACDARLDRNVAVKVLAEGLACDPEALTRFEREARAIAALSHPNVLAIHDFGIENGVPFTVTELLEGKTLRARLEESALPIGEALDYAVQEAEGLAAAHEKGIVHRDLKPENLFLTKDGRLKILDFGLARQLPPDPDDVSTKTSTAAQTDPGTVMGTAGYMSPEQARGESADAQSDIFAFGAILYEMISGRRAFLRRTTAETFAALLTETPEELLRTETMPGAVRAVIARCLEKTPALRYASARDLVHDLRAAAADPDFTKPPGRRPSRRRPASLAVLPFVNAEGDPDADFLSDGLTESLINSLMSLRHLRVMARSTMFRFKGRNNDPRAAGRELGVDAVVAGIVSRRNGDVEVQLELVDARDGSRLWGHRYEGGFAQLPALQDQMADDLRGHLGLRSRNKPSHRPSETDRPDSATFELYLKGRYHWNKRTEEGYVKAIGLFEDAIARVPGFALAHAGLSDAYCLLGGYGHRLPKEAFPRARDAALRALALDESLAEAHTSLGIVLHRFDWQWQKAEKEFRCAIALNPSYVTAHHWYGLYLLTMGRFDEALTAVGRAEALDPLSLVAREDKGYIFYCRRDYDRAAAEYRAILELDPSFANAHFDIGVAYSLMDRHEDALAEIQKGIDFAGRRPRSLANLGYALARAGDTAPARAILEEIGRASFVPGFSIALVLVALGDNDRALETLAAAVENREDALVSLSVNPRLDPLRSDPRFDDLLRRMNFPRIP